MVKKYETLIVFDGSLPEETIAKEQKSFEDFLAEKFSFERSDIWGKKELAYEINKKKSGYYVLFVYDGEGNVNEMVHDHVKLNTKVIRQMTVLYTEVKAFKERVREEDSENKKRSKNG